MPNFRRLVLLGALAICGAAAASAAPLPANLAGALEAFRADGPKGWAYTQTTVAGPESLVETFDPARPPAEHWALIKKDGRAPTPAELKSYREGKSRNTGGAPAPRLQDQIDRANAAQVRAAGDLAWWRFPMKPGAADDSSAAHLDVTFCFHLPTLTVTSVEIASREPYSPVIGINIAETRTVMTYSLPDEGRPSLLQKVTLRVRGRAFWVKSLDQAMDITYSGQQPAARK
jgi:hypothetical protein